jgi:acyl carrier protein
MQIDRIESKILAFLRSDILAEEALLSPTDSLEDAGIGSLALMELIFFLEREYQRKFPAEMLRAENIESVRTLAGYVARLLEHEAA